MKAYLFKFKGSTVLTDCGAGFVVIAGNFLERPVSFLNQVLIWYDSCRQKQTSAHPDAMLVYDNVETAIAEKLARGLTNLLLSKRKWHRSFRHGFVNARSLLLYSFFTTVFNQLRSANASDDSSSWFLGAALHSSSTVSSHFACKVMLRKGR